MRKCCPSLPRHTGGGTSEIAHGLAGRPEDRLTIDIRDDLPLAAATGAGMGLALLDLNFRVLVRLVDKHGIRGTWWPLTDPVNVGQTRYLYRFGCAHSLD